MARFVFAESEHGEWGSYPHFFIHEMVVDSIEREIEARVGELGFEFVELERAGSRTRPILRVKIDRPDATPGHGVTLDECAQVSRALERFLDAGDVVPERYVLEVSSPGIERPLVRASDYERFSGREVAVVGHDLLDGKSKRLEGTLLGLDSGDDRVRLRLASGEVADIPRTSIARAHLIFRWDA